MKKMMKKMMATMTAMVAMLLMMTTVQTTVAVPTYAATKADTKAGYDPGYDAAVLGNAPIGGGINIEQIAAIVAKQEVTGSIEEPIDRRPFHYAPIGAGNNVDQSGRGKTRHYIPRTISVGDEIFVAGLIDCPVSSTPSL